jgi:hypothetical protein
MTLSLSLSLPLTLYLLLLQVADPVERLHVGFDKFKIDVYE